MEYLKNIQNKITKKTTIYQKYATWSRHSYLSYLMRYVPEIPHFSDEENGGNNNPLA